MQRSHEKSTVLATEQTRLARRAATRSGSRSHARGGADEAFGESATRAMYVSRCEISRARRCIVALGLWRVRERARQRAKRWREPSPATEVRSGANKRSKWSKRELTNVLECFVVLQHANGGVAQLDELFLLRERRRRLVRRTHAEKCREFIIVCAKRAMARASH